MQASQMTRRKAMTLVAAAPAAAVLPAIAAAKSPDLGEFISRHRGAFNRYSAALRHQERADNAFERLWNKKQVMAPTGVLPNGQPCGQRYDIILNTREQILEAIHEAHERTLAVHSAPWVSAAVPGHLVVVKKALDGLTTRAIDFLKDAEAALEAVRKDSGLEDAEAETRAAMEAELKARVELVLYLPTNEGERARKASYILSSVPFRDRWSVAQDFVDALIKRSTMLKAEGWQI